MNKVFLTETVLEAARTRMALVFDRFENILVSVSSGKDSTALYWLAVEEAQKRGRKIVAFFLDQEVEYQSSIDFIETMMAHPSVEAQWYQVPLRLTNATSYQDEFLHAWGEGEAWMRAKHPLAIHSIEEPYLDRFYTFFDWKERATDNTAFLVGLRAEESLNRFRAVVKNPGFEDVNWSTRTKNPTSFRFYPIFDWGMGDVWKFIGDSGVPYNTIYDKMLADNQNYYQSMRVSNLIHEKSFECLTKLQILEPETFDKITARLAGTHLASIYANEASVFGGKSLPESFESWRQWRDYLLETAPLTPERRERFAKRFGAQEDSEAVYRQQARQLCANDWENNLPTTQGQASKRREVMQKWRDLL